MKIQERVAVINTAASATQNLPVEAVNVSSVVGLAGAATSIAATTYTVQTAAPGSSSEVQFTGTPDNPSKTLTFDAALTANGLLLVTYSAVGDLPANL